MGTNGTFRETLAKQAVREMLADAAGQLGRTGLTYLGLPGREAKDVLRLRKLLRQAICVDTRQEVLDACSTQLGRLSLDAKQFVCEDMWSYLKAHYPSEPLMADVLFLDFCGGGILSDDPFATEIAGLRALLAKHSKTKNQAFILAWTYMPHDKGPDAYRAALGKLKLTPADEALVNSFSGVRLRSLSIRLLIKLSFQEHNMLAKVYHHALYKKTMNTIIVIFSAGVDERCSIQLDDPDAILQAAVYRYDDKAVAPSPEWLIPPAVDPSTTA